MSSIASLRATNCVRLAPLDAMHVVVYGPKTAYVYDTNGTSCGSFTAPREADCFVLHRVERVGHSDVALLYATSTADKEGSAFFLKQEGEDASIPLTVPQPSTGSVVDLHILNGAFLVARTASAVALYHLDSLAAEADTRSGGDGLALSRVGDDIPFRGGASVYVHSKGNELLVASCSEGRLHAQVLTVSPSSCAAVCQTPAEGVLLPTAKASVEIVSWAQDWRRMELVLLTREAAGTPSVHILSLLSGMWVTDRSAPWPEATLEGIRDLIATSDNALWGVDKASGPFVTLRRASSAFTVELPGTNATANVLVTEVGGALFVLCGKSLLRVEKDVKEPSLQDWLAKAVAEDTTTSGDATAVLQFVKGTSSCFESIVHDTSFVRYTAVNSSFSHEILQGASRLDSQASLRYVAVAHSFHWYTALRVLHQQGDDGLVLAIASLLALKRAQDGRSLLGDAQQAAAAFFNEPSFLAPTGGRKLYIATLCRAMRTALAVGALDALGVLCTVTDATVTAVYTSELWRDEVPPQQAGSCDAEITIASTISLLSSYADWAVQAGSMLGVITAHVGPPRMVKKEAMLLDGKAHPIRTFRQVEIKPFALDKKKRS